MENQKIAAVFPGQGSQKPGMAQDFVEHYPAAKAAFDEAGEALELDLAAICFADDDSRLNLTEYTQPAILTAEIAQYRVLMAEFGLSCDLFAGHSLGEYTALVAAGVIPFAAGVKLVRKRGALMQAAVPKGQGGMAAIIFPEIEKQPLRECVEECGAEVANFNSLEQVVISGSTEAVSKAAENFKERLTAELGENEVDGKLRIHMLEVSAPFHSSMMQPIEAEFEEYLNSYSSGFDLERASRVVSNYTASFHTPDTLIQSLVKQISGSVRWVENMRLLTKHSQQIYEIGPNRPLQSFFRSIDCEIKSIINLRSAKKTFSVEKT